MGDKKEDWSLRGCMDGLLRSLNLMQLEETNPELFADCADCGFIRLKDDMELLIDNVFICEHCKKENLEKAMRQQVLNQVISKAGLEKLNPKEIIKDIKKED